MIVQAFVVGRFLTNCYLASCEQTKEAIIIDPGFDGELEAQTVLESVDRGGLKLRYILNTHGHSDHTCGNGFVKQRFQVSILIHELDADMLEERGRRIAESLGLESFSPEADILLHDGDLVRFGEQEQKVIHTPGHSPGGISLLGKAECFTGDTLFEGSIGRTDFPNSSERDMAASLKKLASLPDDFVVYPGHGAKTTIGNEKRWNPFLRGFGS